jgi:hypothetical protein
MSNVSLVGKEEDKTKEDEEEKEGATVKIQMLRRRDNRERMEKVVQNTESERIYSWVIYFF